MAVVNDAPPIVVGPWAKDPEKWAASMGAHAKLSILSRQLRTSVFVLMAYVIGAGIVLLSQKLALVLASSGGIYLIITYVKYVQAKKVAVKAEAVWQGKIREVDPGA